MDLVLKRFWLSLIFVVVAVLFYLNTGKIYKIVPGKKSTYMFRREEKVPLCTMQERATHFKNSCATYKDKLPGETRPSMFYVSDELQVAYCYTAKCASSVFKTLLAASTPYSKKRGIKIPLDHIHKSSRANLAQWGLRPVRYSLKNMAGLANYSKILILRNPFDRLVSAFRNKVLRGRFRAINVRFKNQFGVKKSAEIQFWMFVEGLLEDGKYSNAHWNPLGRHCFPCDVDYDYMLRIETLERDLALVLQRLNLSAEGVIRKNEVRPETIERSRIQTNYVSPRKLQEFMDVPLKNVKRLYDKYYYDFALNGYGYNLDSHDAYCSVQLDNNKTCC